MNRRLTGIVSLISAVVLLAIGGLTMAGGLFIHNQVTDELTAQKIYFAPAGSEGLPANIQDYGGTQVVNGAQAKVFANDYIRVHVLGSISGAAKANPELNGATTYAEVSAASRANPKNQELSGLVQTVFRGEMLRASLLSSYAWWTFGTILFWIAIASLSLGLVGVLAGVLLATPLGARLHWHRHGGRAAHA
jgi:membrane-associated protease RseP (regulator of RpoE activity)